jgi:hypothetical protein
MPGVFPDYPAPVVRNAGGERELTMMRWGMPPPPRAGGFPVTNIRNTSSPHWRAWLKPESRCLVPFNSFAEYAPEPNPDPKRKGWSGSRSTMTDRSRRSVTSGPSSKPQEAPDHKPVLSPLGAKRSVTKIQSQLQKSARVAASPSLRTGLRYG